MLSRLAPVLVVAVTLALFAPIVGYDFVTWDDPDFVYANPRLFPATPESVARLWHEPNALTYTTYVVLSAVPSDGTISPVAVHATSLLLHAVAALAAWALLVRLVGDPVGATAGALLFALHPMQVEPVAWATGLKDVLSGCLGLLALLAWVRGRGGLAGTIWLVLALLAKPTAVVVPVMAAILDATVLRRAWRTSLWALIPWIVASLVFGVLVIVGQAEALRDAPPLWARPLIAADAIVFYARQLVAPITLGPDYGRTPAAVLDAPMLSLIALAAVAIAGGLVLRARRPWLTASVGLFVAGLLPVLGLTPFNFQRYSTVADRYCYLALLGPALALASLIARRRRQTILALTAVGLVVLGVRTVVQLPVWRDSVTLLEHGVAVNPKSWGMYENLGGVRTALRQPDAAIAAYRTSLALRPDRAAAHYNLGTALFGQGRADEAIVEWQETLRLDPSYILAHYNLGSVLAQRGDVDAAEAHFQDAVRIAPDFTAAQNALKQITEWRRTQPAEAP